MTEYDLFVSSIPVIAEIVAGCRSLDRQGYEEWKQETMVHAPDAVKGFMGKVMVVIDKHVLESVK